LFVNIKARKVNAAPKNEKGDRKGPFFYSITRQRPGNDAEAKQADRVALCLALGGRSAIADLTGPAFKLPAVIERMLLPEFPG
jgi:hypothetical protein